MKFLAIIFVLFATFLITDAQLSWDSCGSDGFKVDSVSLSPKAPVVGKDLEISAAATFSEKVTAGKVSLKVHYGFIPIVDKTHDLCTLSPKFSCPLSGKQTIDKTVTVPSEAPAGKFTGKARVYDQDNNEIGCIKFTLHLNDKSSENTHENMLIDSDMIRDVNKQGLWRATVHSMFSQMTVADGQKLLHNDQHNDNAVDDFDISEVSQLLPNRFDAREKWTDCIRSSAANDRYCIHGNHKTTQTFQVGERPMMREIYNNGPIEATIDIYQDFFGYHGGVYSHLSGSFVGQHTVKIIGWDYDNLTKQPYWIAKNTFDPKWGMNGYFWILRGSNEVNIENNKVEDVIALF